ncbi:MAG: FHA domain-containing protein [Lachnospiraceae bacterium]|nr:FHA domain-containing protein [Lachnospiraceae bacterium]
MNRKYVREVNRTYMVLPGSQQGSNFAMRMMQENEFRFLLKNESRVLDGEERIYYDVTAMNSLADICASMNLSADMLEELFEQLRKAREELEAYLLDAAGIHLDPEAIYYSLSLKEFRFLYLPEEAEDTETALKKLTEFLVQRIDHNRPELVEKAYEMYEDVWTKGADLTVLLEKRAGQSERSGTVRKADTDEDWRKDIFYEEGEREEDFDPAEPYRDGRRTGERKTGSGETAEWISARTTDETKLLSEEKLVEESTWTVHFMKYGWLLFLILGGAIYAGVRWMFALTLTEQILLPAIMVAGMTALYFLGRYLVTKKREDAEQEALTREKLRLARLAVQEEAMEALGEAKEEEKTVFLGANQQKKYYLLGLEDGEEERIALNKFPFQVGKSTAVSDYVVSDPSVSRLHARFGKNEKGDVTVTDLGSLNQTFVNGIALEPHEERTLDLSDEIQIGRTTFLLRASYA